MRSSNATVKPDSVCIGALDRPMRRRSIHPSLCNARSVRALLALCFALSLILIPTVTPAQAALIHEFEPKASEELEKGVPLGCAVKPNPPLAEPPCISGPLSTVDSMTVDSGHLWVAEHVQRESKSAGSRVDEFNASTGAFARQLSEEGGVHELGSGVAVGHPAGEEEVYVGAAHNGNAVAVFGPSGKLQPEGVWSGANTPSARFAEIVGVAVSANVGSTQNDVYVSTGAQVEECASSFSEGKPKCVVDVFPGEAHGKEPAKVLAELTGTCEKAGEALPCTGSKLIPFGRPNGVAVSPLNGDVFVSDGTFACGTEVVEKEKTRLEPECAVDAFEPTAIVGVYNFLFRISGAPGEPFAGHGVRGQMTVDSEGSIYVANGVGSLVYQFDATGKFATRLKGTSPEAPFTEVRSIAADPATGNVYVGDRDSVQNTAAVDVFGPSLLVPDVTTTAATTLQFNGEGKVEATLNGTVNPRNLGEATCAFAWGTSKAFGHETSCQPSGVPNQNVAVPVKATINEKLTPGTVLEPDTTYFFRLHATTASSKRNNPGEESEDLQFLTPGPGIHSESASEVASTSATLNAAVNPNGAPTSFYFQYGRTTAYEEPPVPAAPGAPIGAAEADVQVAPQHIQSLEPNTVYHYRVIAISQLSVEGSLKAVPFTGPDETFTTQGSGGGGTLPDGRRWELVSPPDKHGAQLEPIGEDAVIRASAAGDRVTYVARTATEESLKGYIAVGVQVFSTRAPGGWSSKDISLPRAAPAGLPGGFGLEYRSFSSDLSLGLVEPLGSFTSLTPEVSPRDTERTPYVRHDTTCAATPATCFEPLVTHPGDDTAEPFVPFGGNPELEGHGFFGEATFVGSSPDLAHVVLSSHVPLTSTPFKEGPEGHQLYERSAGKPASEQLQLVSLLPPNGKGEELPGDNVTLGFQDSGHGFVRGAVSEDGSRVVWSAGRVGGGGAQPGVHLYMRDTVGHRTVQLDAPQCLPGECGGGEADAHFQLASAGGARVLFTDPQRLTSNASTTPGRSDLYQCEISEVAGKLHCKLTDLTPSPDPRNPADVQGAVIGASEDGSWVYFVANGVLGDGGEHGAVTGHCDNGGNGHGPCNLYVYHQGGTHLIGVMAGADEPSWDGVGGADTDLLAARVSPNGQWLAFMSSRSLTGYDNHDAVSGKPDEEVFLYHAEPGAPGRLVCASCDPSGARPTGVEYAKLENKLVGGRKVWGEETWIAANVPGWTPYVLGHALYQSRYLSDSGRLFFNSGDALVPQDINNNQDVYQYEPALGAGGGTESAAGAPATDTCTVESPTYSPRSEGCVSLISSGRAAGESAFLDASENGNDVFFLTAEKLVPKDVDTAIDVYDAHVCSAAAPCSEEAQAPPPCATADSCRAAPAPQPGIFGSPPSATFSGPGHPIPPPPAKPPVRTNKPKLAKALVSCRRTYTRSKKRRTTCEKHARRAYGATARKATNHRRST